MPCCAAARERVIKIAQGTHLATRRMLSACSKVIA
jgi:hypothetical protein